MPYLITPSSKARMHNTQELTTKSLRSSAKLYVRVHINYLHIAFKLSMWVLLTEILVRTYEIRATAVKHVRILVLWNLLSKYSGVVYT